MKLEMSQIENITCQKYRWQQSNTQNIKSLNRIIESSKHQQGRLIARSYPLGYHLGR